MAILTPSPEVYFLGTQDFSKRQVLPEPLPIPQHCPLQFGFMQKGPDTKDLAVGAQMLLLYGEESFDKNSRYFNHSTVFMNGFSSKGNTMMIHRLIPDDAGPKSNMTLYVDVATTDVPNYLRNSDGSLVYDNDTQTYKTDPDTPTIDGYKVKYIKDFKDSEELLVGSNSIRTGTMKNKDDSDSTMYPILDLQARFKGRYYNNIGFTLDTYQKDVIPNQVLESSKSFPYKLSVLHRKDETTSPVIHKSVYGEPNILTTLNTSAINEVTEKNFSIEDVLEDYYKNELDGDPRVQLMYSDFSEVHIYTNHVETLLAKLATKEQQLITDTDEVFSDGNNGSRSDWYDYTNNDLTNVIGDELYMFNLFTLKTMGLISYQSVIMSTDTPSLSGNLSEVQISSSTPIWLNGGSDGTLSNEVFEQLVSKEMDKYLDPNSEVMDLAVNSETILYDSGFTLPLKKNLVNFIGVRPNTVVMMSTYDASLKGGMSLSHERAVASAIISKLRMMPESTHFGTGVMRGCIVQQSGVDRLRVYKNRIPLLFDYAMKGSELMGAGNGSWKDGSFFDKQPGNIVNELVDIQPDFIPANVKPILWGVGLVWAQKRDRNEMFYPSSQTIYDNGTSVLNNFFTVMVISHLNTVAYRTWQRFTGDTDLSPSVFKVDVESYFRYLINNGSIFLNKYDIKPEVYFTDTDVRLGYSWHLKIKVSGNNMKTVMTTHVDAFRMEV